MEQLAPRPLQMGQTLQVIPKLGKYAFKYDFSNGIQINCITFPCPSIQGSNFSKGDVVNVVGFRMVDGGDYKFPDYKYVEVENVKYDSSKPTGWVNLENQKTIQVPIGYLEKIDDSTPVTLQTGINFGQNTIPAIQGTSVILPNPVMPIPIKSLPPKSIFETTLEENAKFILTKDFQYVSGYGSSSCGQSGICTMDMSPKYSVLKAGTKVAGKLFREIDNTAYKVKAGTSTPAPYKDFLAVKGYGTQGSINIPIEYLKRDNGTVVPVKKDNKILIVAGALLAGYLLFSKSE